MQRYFITLYVGVLIFVQTTIAIAGQLSSSLEQYIAQVNAVPASASNETVKTYLQECLAAADQLQGLEAGDSRVSAAFGVLVQKRIEAGGLLTPQHTRGEPAVTNETAAYRTHLNPYRYDEYISLIKLQDQLFERKYFKTETAKEANFLEGYVNGHLSLTRAEHDDINKILAEKHLGVSPWEAIFRFEPALALNGGVQAAIIGAVGLSYTFFPDIDKHKTPASFDESVLSNYIEKSGARLGIGVGAIDNKARALLGAGLQINALGLWAFYEPKDRHLMLGISACDLSKIKKFVSWFE